MGFINLHCHAASTQVVQDRISVADSPGVCFNQSAFQFVEPQLTVIGKSCDQVQIFFPLQGRQFVPTWPPLLNDLMESDGF